MATIDPYSLIAVKSRNDFYGFKDQWEEVDSSIKQSVTGDSRNICFIGEPSTGKTSFLNICEESCKERGIHTSRVNVSVGCLPFDFFNTVFLTLLNSLTKDLNSTPFGNMKRDYLEISKKGESSRLCDLDFPLAYYDWKHRKKPKDEYPDLTTVENDLSTIYGSYETELFPKRSDASGKIAIFIDDFQKIVGIDEKGNVKDKSNIEQTIKNADAICETLRTIIERHSNKFFFFVATYPGLVREPFELPRKMVRRCFKPIDVNQFNNEEETKELILGCLKKLSKDHAWYRLLVEGDVSILRDGFVERFGELRDDIYKYFFDSNINSLVRTVHNDSEGRPFAIKLEMAKIFQYFEKPADDDWKLIRFDALDKWQKIYKAVSNALKDNPFYEIIEGYSLETKFHLYLLINNRRLDIDEIIAYLKFCIICYHISLFDKKSYSLEKISDEEITKKSTFFNGELSDLRNISKEKLEKSLQRFIKDGILEYEELETVHYRDNIPILDSNYIRYHLDSLGFPNIKSTVEFFVAKVKKFNETVFNEHVLYHRKFVTLRPGISSEVEVEHLKMFLGNPSTIDSYPTDAIPENLVSAILERKWFTDYVLIRLMKLELKTDNLHREWLSFIACYPLELSDDGIPIYMPVDLNEEDLIKKNIYERLVSCEKNNTGFVFKYTDYGNFHIDYLQRFQLACALEKNASYVENVREFRKSSPQQFWEMGEIDMAIESADLIISNLSSDDSEKIHTEISNHVYLSLCQNNKRKARECLKKYKDYITRPTTQKPLSIYNFTMLRVFLGKIVPQNLVKLMNRFLDNKELLEESKSRDLLTCLVLFGERQASFVQVQSISVFESLFVSIKSLIKNGERINHTRTTNERMLKEFLSFEKSDKGYYKKLDKHLPGIEKLIKAKA